MRCRFHRDPREARKRGRARNQQGLRRRSKRLAWQGATSRGEAGAREAIPELAASWGVAMRYCAGGQTLCGGGARAACRLFGRRSREEVTESVGPAFARGARGAEMGTLGGIQQTLIVCEAIVTSKAPRFNPRRLFICPALRLRLDVAGRRSHSGAMEASSPNLEIPVWSFGPSRNDGVRDHLMCLSQRARVFHEI